MGGVRSALDSLRRGEFVLLHDSEGREDEVDMVVAAEFVTPEHVARMRQHAGGLLCIALDRGFADVLGLRYMHELLGEAMAQEDRGMVMGLAPYGDRPTFSISVNHYRTYTGITDRDRATTIQEMARLHGLEGGSGGGDGDGGDGGAHDIRRRRFVSSFRTPGHVPLLVASGGLLEDRQGHTEMSVYLAGAAGAGLAPVTAICEMMDAQTYSALSVEGAARYARSNGVPLVDGRELMEHYAGVRQG